MTYMRSVLSLEIEERERIIEEIDDLETATYFKEFIGMRAELEELRLRAQLEIRRLENGRTATLEYQIQENKYKLNVLEKRHYIDKYEEVIRNYDRFIDSELEYVYLKRRLVEERDRLKHKVKQIRIQKTR